MDETTETQLVPWREYHMTNGDLVCSRDMGQGCNICHFTKGDIPKTLFILRVRF